MVITARGWSKNFQTRMCRAVTKPSTGVCTAYPETVSCSSTGGAACRFIFEGMDATVTVVAQGADAGHLKVVAVRRSAQKDVEWQRHR